MRNKLVYLSALHAGAALVGVPAFAQDRTTQPDDASTIIVTARRVEERLQDVPISITVFNQKQIDNRNVVSANDLAAYTPSLTTSGNRYGSSNATFAIRGFTQEVRTSPSVGIYFADVVAPRAGNGGVPAGNGAGPGSFFDLQNVQVLKGPQGTLFGRNTTGGAVLLIPKKPTSRFEGYVEGTYGTYDTKRVQAVVNVPLMDSARLRLGVDRYSRDGYLRSISGIGPSRFNDIDYVSARASLVVDLAPDLENYTIASYTRSDVNGALAKLTNCVPGFPFGTLACAELARLAGRGFYVAENALPDARSLTTQWQVINTTTFRASDQLTIKNVASYSQIRNTNHAEIFGTRFVIPTTFGPIANTGQYAGSTLTFANIYNPTGHAGADQYSYTEELQFQGKLSDRLIWQGGAYLEVSDPLNRSGSQSAVLASCPNLAGLQCTDPVGALIGAPGLGSINYVLGETRFRNLGIYAQSTYTLTDQLKLTGGIRYTSDRTTTAAQGVIYRFLQPNVPTGFCTLGRPGSAPITNPAQCEVASQQKSHAPTWLIDLDYSPSNDVLIYAKYSRGYRQGSANYSAPLQFQTFGPEKVDSYELGTKTSFHGAMSGTFDAAIFYNDFTNQQLGLGLISSTNAATPTQAIVNGGKSRIAGAEVNVTLSPFRGFNVDGGYTYLSTKLKSLTAPPVQAGALYDTFQFAAVAGSRLAFTPTHKLSGTASYTLPLSRDIGAVTIGATYTYTSNLLIIATPKRTLPALSLVNLNLNWSKIAGTPLDLAVFVTNLTAKKYYTFINDQSRTGFISQTVGEPRMIGARLRYNFGS